MHRKAHQKWPLPDGDLDSTGDFSLPASAMQGGVVSLGVTDACLILWVVAQQKSRGRMDKCHEPNEADNKAQIKSERKEIASSLPFCLSDM